MVNRKKEHMNTQEREVALRVLGPVVKNTLNELMGMFKELQGRTHFFEPSAPVTIKEVERILLLVFPVVHAVELLLNKDQEKEEYASYRHS